MCYREEIFLALQARGAQKNEQSFVHSAIFDVSFLQVKTIDFLGRFVRPFIYHCSRFGSMQIQCKQKKKKTTMRGLSRHVNALQCTNAMSDQVCKLPLALNTEESDSRRDRIEVFEFPRMALTCPNR